MTLVTLSFMRSMYEGRTIKIAVLALAALAFVSLLVLNRNRTLVSDTTFMQSMIPHHSIAINNARTAAITDSRVRSLANYGASTGLPIAVCNRSCASV